MSDTPSNPVTIKAMAQIAGVSHATVSRALRNHPRIARATCKRIQDLALQLGYRPNPALSALIAYRNRRRVPTEYEKIAVLNAWDVPEPQLPAYFLRQLCGVRERAAELGYDVELFTVGPDAASQARLSRILIARGIVGLVAGPLPADWPMLQMTWEDFSPVAIGHSIMKPNLHAAASNHSAAVEMAYEKLRELGYKRIGFSDKSGSERRNRHLHLASYLRCLHSDGVSSDASPPLLFDTLHEWDPVPWVKRHRFDAVIIGYERDFLDKLKNHGMQAPRDLAVAGFAVTEDHLTGVREDLHEVGRYAMTMLHSMLINGERGLPTRHHSVLIDGTWQTGRTAKICQTKSERNLLPSP